MKTIKMLYIFLGILLVAGGVFLLIQKKDTGSQYIADELVSQENLEGCYVAALGKDEYSLHIISSDEGKISGTLVFNNFEKDSSSGTLTGEYSEGIILGEYNFFSEGMDSVMQVIFKKTDNGFQRGFGPVDAETGTRFTDLSMITFDNEYEFIKTDTPCPAPWERPI